MCGSQSVLQRKQNNVENIKHHRAWERVSTVAEIRTTDETWHSTRSWTCAAVTTADWRKTNVSSLFEHWCDKSWDKSTGPVLVWISTWDFLKRRKSELTFNSNKRIDPNRWVRLVLSSIWTRAWSELWPGRWRPAGWRWRCTAGCSAECRWVMEQPVSECLCTETRWSRAVTTPSPSHWL